MAGLAARGRMRAFEGEVRLGMIKGLCIEMDDVRFSPKVITVAAFAIQISASGDPPVITEFLLDVSGNVFMIMAVNAAPALSMLAECLVTLFAVCLKFGVTTDQFARHQHDFQRRSCCLAAEESHAQPERQPKDEAVVHIPAARLSTCGRQLHGRPP